MRTSLNNGGGLREVRRATSQKTEPTASDGGEIPQFVAIVAVAGGGLQFHNVVGATRAAAEVTLNDLLTDEHVVLAKVSAGRFQQMLAASSSAQGACHSKTTYAAFFSLAGILMMLVLRGPDIASIGDRFAAMPKEAGVYICTVRASVLDEIARHFASASGHALVHVQSASLK